MDRFFFWTYGLESHCDPGWFGEGQYWKIFPSSFFVLMVQQAPLSLSSLSLRRQIAWFWIKWVCWRRGSVGGGRSRETLSLIYVLFLGPDLHVTPHNFQANSVVWVLRHDCYLKCSKTCTCLYAGEPALCSLNVKFKSLHDVDVIGWILKLQNAIIFHHESEIFININYIL